MSGQEFLIEKLNARFLDAKSRNPLFSLRSFARQLGVSISVLSEIRSRKRPLTKKLAIRLSDKLLLSPREKQKLLFDLDNKIHNIVSSHKSRERLLLSEDHFELISDWPHLSILSLINVSDFKSSDSWIAKRLGISLSKAKKCLDRLKRLNLIKIGRGGKIERTTASISTSDEVASLAIKKSHIQSTELARKAILDTEVEKRDFTTATMAIDSRRIEEAKKLIRAFRDQMADFLEAGEADDVYQLSIQLYPCRDSEI